MRIAIATDAWHPQVNGVVRTYENTAEQLARLGHSVELITPAEFRTVPCPTYSSIRLAVLPGGGVARRMQAFQPDAIHIATEGPLGLAARSYCVSRRLPFSTSFHTQFPEYIRMRAPIPAAWTYAWLRRFHARAGRTLVPTESMRERLRQRGFANLALWCRGVDTALFMPGAKDFLDLPRPVFMYVGRVAVEKNLNAFLELELPGSKLVVGDGPDLLKLRGQYADAHFTGFKTGAELARHVAAADVFVFPSLTDTFGIVMLEALACGVPVAAFPVTGPVDVIQHGVTGMLDWDLKAAALAALCLDPLRCVQFAKDNSWRRCAESFLQYLQPLRSAPAA